MKSRIALLAGEGQMPLRILEEMHAQGYKVFLVAIEGITSNHLIALADEACVLSITQMGKAIRLLRRRRICELVLAGRVLHKNIFSIAWWKLDWTTLRLWFSLKDKRADTILQAIVECFSKAGIEVCDSTRFLRHMVAKEGVLTEKKPSARLWEEIAFGIEMARLLGKADIGQTVIVKDLAVVAVEAMEGTDSCIERAYALAGPGCIVVKSSKPGQDMRFDVPVIGRNTLEKLVKVQACVLAVESKKTVLLDPEAKEFCDQYGLILVVFERGFC